MTDTAELLSVVLTLRPLEAAPELPPVGRAAHALALEALRQFDAALAEQIHAGSGARPLTVSDLIGYSRKRGVRPERTYTLRFTALTGPVAQGLAEAARGGVLAPGAEIRLGEASFKIEGVATEREAHPWAASFSYEALSAPWLLGRVTPGPRIELQFASPTMFKSNGLHVPAPLPGWVFGSLLEKWNAFAPVALPPEARRFAEECLALSGFELRSRAGYVKEGGVRVGAVGTARYTAINRDRYWMSLMNLLADFALFAGVGAGTTMGLGQCRRIATQDEGGGQKAESRKQ